MASDLPPPRRRPGVFLQMELTRKGRITIHKLIWCFSMIQVRSKLPCPGCPSCIREPAPLSSPSITFPTLSLFLHHVLEILDQSITCAPTPRPFASSQGPTNCDCEILVRYPLHVRRLCDLYSTLIPLSAVCYARGPGRGHLYPAAVILLFAAVAIPDPSQ